MAQLKVVKKPGDFFHFHAQSFGEYFRKKIDYIYKAVIIIEYGDQYGKRINKTRN